MLSERGKLNLTFLFGNLFVEGGKGWKNTGWFMQACFYKNPAIYAFKSKFPLQLNYIKNVPLIFIFILVTVDRGRESRGARLMLREGKREKFFLLPIVRRSKNSRTPMQKVQTSSSSYFTCFPLHTSEKEENDNNSKTFFSGSGCEYCAVFLPLEKAIKTFSLSPPVSFTYLKGNRRLSVPPPWFMERENTSSVRSNDGKVFFCYKEVHAASFNLFCWGIGILWNLL